MMVQGQIFIVTGLGGAVACVPVYLQPVCMFQGLCLRVHTNLRNHPY